jgi:ATP-dependent helicase/nuclease subunit B
VNAALLPARDSLIEEVARRIEEAGSDYSGCLVVFPGKRPSHFLRQRLAEKRKTSFIPPRILSMDELVDDVFGQLVGTAGPARPKLEAIDAVAILYDIQAAAARPLGGDAFMTLDSFFPLGMKIYGDVEELAIEGIPARSVAEVQPLVEEEVPPRSRERLRSMAFFYEEFYREVDRRGFSTRSSRYVTVSETIESRHVRENQLVLFAGFYALTRTEQAMFRKLGGWPAVQLVFQDGPGMKRRLAGLGVKGLAETGAPEGPGPEAHFYTSPDTHGQVFALNAALQKTDADTLIVLPSPSTLFPLLRHCLSRFDPESYNISLPYPLQRTPLYGFLNDLMEVVSSMDGERVYLPDYISFVLHPYVKNVRLGASAEATRVLFHTLEERRGSRGTQRFATLEEIETDEELFDDAARRIAATEERPAMAAALRLQLADIHARTIGSFRSFASVRDFAERCIALITWVHDESTARDHPFFGAFAESFVASLEGIRQSLMAEKSFNDTGSYFLLLRRYLQTRHLPFPGTPLHDLQVLGTLETRTLKFSRVFILDANEGELPETGSESTLLPLPVRASLGLSTYREQEDIAAYHFAVLTAGARELHLFSVQSGEKERSRFAERLLWEKEKQSGAFGDRGIVKAIQYRVSLTTRVPASVLKTAEMVAWLKLREYSATSLDTYLRCPLKFYYKVVLHLGEREEATAGIEAADIGIFVHEVLFRYFSSRAGRLLTGDDADPAAMAALVEEIFSERFGPADAGTNRLLLNQLRRHLKDFVEGYLGPLIRGHRVSFGELERTMTASRNGFSLKGRLDAVQERDGVPHLIDYKTSAHRSNYVIRMKKLVLEERASWATAIPTLQLPFYVLLRAAASGVAPTDIQAMFLLLGRTAMDKGIEAPLFDEPAEAAEAWPRLQAVIDGLLQEIVSLDVPFAPTPDLKSACPWCEFTAICGTAWLARG